MKKLIFFLIAITLFSIGFAGLYAAEQTNYQNFELDTL